MEKKTIRSVISVGFRLLDVSSRVVVTELPFSVRLDRTIIGIGIGIGSVSK